MPTLLAARRGDQSRCQWAVLWWTLPALPLAWLLWRAVHQPAVSNAGLLRSAFDVRLCWPNLDLQTSTPLVETVHAPEMAGFLHQY